MATKSIGQADLRTICGLAQIEALEMSGLPKQCSEFVLSLVEMESISNQGLQYVPVERYVIITYRSLKTCLQTHRTVPRYPDLDPLSSQISSLSWSYPASHAILA